MTAVSERDYHGGWPGRWMPRCWWCDKAVIAPAYDDDIGGRCAYCGEPWHAAMVLCRHSYDERGREVEADTLPDCDCRLLRFTPTMYREILCGHARAMGHLPRRRNVIVFPAEIGGSSSDLQG